MKVTLVQLEGTTTLRLTVEIDEANVSDTNAVVVQVTPSLPLDPNVGQMTIQNTVLNPYMASVPADNTDVTLDIPVTPGFQDIYVQVVDASNNVLDFFTYSKWEVHPAYWSSWGTWLWVALAALTWILLVTFGILGAMRVKDSRKNVAWFSAILGLFPGTTFLELIPITMGYGCGP